MGLNLAQLRALVAVADTGGFGLAADELGISQSAVSHAVAALERAVGGTVFRRNGGGGASGAGSGHRAGDASTAGPGGGGGPVRCTALGEQLLPHARTAVMAADAVMAIAGRHGRAPAGTVRLAAPPTVCLGLLPELLREWAAALPRIRVRVFEGDDDEVAAWLESGTADAAVLVDPEPAPASHQHDGPGGGPGGRVLAEDRLCALVRRDDPLAGQPVVEPRDLEDDEFLLSGGGCERQVREVYRRAGARFAPVHRIRGLGTLIGMVRAGVGVSIVPELARPMLPAGLVLVPVRPAVRRRLVLTGPASRPWHPAVAALVSAVPAASGAVPGGAGGGSRPRR
jgi:DNA-binding transcriptional LysR family regulator